MPSFRLALEVGADALETDVHLTADGHVVVSHDDTGARMAGIPRAIRDSTLAEVQSWDVGRGFVTPEGERPFAGCGYRIPCFEELLVEFRGIRINVDVKPRDPAILGPLLTLIRRHRAEEWVRLASFSSRTTTAIRRLGYEGETSLGREEVIALLVLPGAAYRRLPRPLRGDAAQVPTSFHGFALSRPWFLARCRSAGLRVDFFTVNDPAEANRLVALGVDGIMTDDPRRIAPVLRGRE